jgi:hypothetical protein
MPAARSSPVTESAAAMDWKTGIAHPAWVTAREQPERPRTCYPGR